MYREQRQPALKDRLISLQFGLNLRESIEHWNKGTNHWLRLIVYERAKTNATLWTYALSAFWHGFYPGYYLTFANGALFTFAARTVSVLAFIPSFNLFLILSRDFQYLSPAGRSFHILPLELGHLSRRIE